MAEGPCHRLARPKERRDPIRRSRQFVLRGPDSRFDARRLVDCVFWSRFCPGPRPCSSRGKSRSQSFGSNAHDLSTPPNNESASRLFGCWSSDASPALPPSSGHMFQCSTAPSFSSRLSRPAPPSSAPPPVCITTAIAELLPLDRPAHSLSCLQCRIASKNLEAEAEVRRAVWPGPDQAAAFSRHAQRSPGRTATISATRGKC